MQTHSKKFDDDEEHDLYLDIDESDDVSVYVTNSSVNSSSRKNAYKGVVASDEMTEVGVGSKCIDIEVAIVDEAVDNTFDTAEERRDETNEKFTDTLTDAKTKQPLEESIRQEAISKAATIIQSMPEVSIVDECIQEVAAHEAKLI